MEEDVLQFLQDVRNVLRCHQVGSIVDYPAAPELSAFLASREEEESPPRKEGIPLQEKEKAATVSSVREKNDQGSLAEIAAEVELCTSCGLAGQRRCVSPGKWGGGRVRLLLVGHWLAVPEHSTAGIEKTVFGPQEDQMLGRMLAAIHLASEEVFVTNIIKCGVGPEIQPQAEHIDACSSYLQRQIMAAAPELICTMGMVATRALLRFSQPLSRLRGRFHIYQGSNGREIPLLPTFHPSYLLQNPEMKKATWQDLQTLEKRIYSK
ncbi:MAG: uracil-DNA glycosylase [Proteobacteria bacterium]|nr:uracil-DNA glycosylase [Pseudomonadota bacterium]MBU1059676.1 uracil-DNA glycosylase [Pseudomonadota bacterium]